MGAPVVYLVQGTHSGCTRLEITLMFMYSLLISASCLGQSLQTMSLPSVSEPVADIAPEAMDNDAGPLMNDTQMPQPIKPIATDQYWDAVARCETATRWHRDYPFGGGLGIYITAWKQFGGLEYAPRAGLATRTQQIIVANRISTQGFESDNHYHYKALGFTGWGCSRHMTPPTLIWHTTQQLLAKQWGSASAPEEIMELQAAFGLAETGEFNERTQELLSQMRDRYAKLQGFEYLGPYHWLPKKQRRSVLLNTLRVVGSQDLPAEPIESNIANPDRP